MEARQREVAKECVARLANLLSDKASGQSCTPDKCSSRDGASIATIDFLHGVLLVGLQYVAQGKRQVEVGSLIDGDSRKLSRTRQVGSIAIELCQ